MPEYTQDQIDAIHELPLRKDVRWIDMSFMFPGKVIEETKRTFDPENPADPATGKWAAIDLETAECAAKVVDAHNSWLDEQVKAKQD